MTATSVGVLDGRTLRRERNRADIVNALLNLMQEGEFEASAAEIAASAGLSERSLFRYFDDVNDLYGEVCAEQFARIQPSAIIEGFAHGTTEQKVAAFVTQRFALHKAIGKVGIAARAHAHHNHVIARQLTDARLHLRHQIVAHFGDELARLDEQSRRAATITIDLCTTFESLQQLLSEHGLSLTSARRALEIAIVRVLQ